jgi:prepilin-type N-terminal cleavage/methylation domain-containing protein
MKKLNRNLAQPRHLALLRRSHVRAGFTLVEIMIVVAIIALLAAIAVPNFLRARKRSQATRILEDLRVIDGAIDQYAIETNKAGGASVSWSDIQSYIKRGSKLYNSTGKDLFNNSFANGSFKVDTIPVVATGTYNELSDVAPAEFWSPFK